MPNWCENILYVRGPRIEYILAHVKSLKSDFDFNKIVRKFSDHFPFKKDDGWYGWRIKYWGTKWNINECEIRRTTRGATIWFSTAWAPPEPLIRRLALQFPDNTFKLKYWEAGCGFKGTLIVKGEDELTSYSENYGGRRGG